MTDTSYPLLSVVMPVYNTRGYLPFTLRNIIVDQFSTMRPKEWELIVVDDGSTDGSHLEVEPWAELFPQSVRLIRKQNAGVSAARNAGIAAARGRYVYFIDSDDILMRRALPRLLDLALKGDADVVKFMFRQISTEEYIRLTDSVPEADIPTDSTRYIGVSEYLEETRGMTMPKIHSSTWQTLYRRQLLADNNVRYNEELTVGEDEVFTWTAMRYVSTVCYSTAEVFLYHQREGSISHADNCEREEKYQLERLKFCGHIISVIDRIKDRMSPEVHLQVCRNYTFGYYHTIIDYIVLGFPMRTIYRSMRSYQKLGGDVHPGRPRFTPFYDSKEQPLSVKIRRMFVAYVLGSIVWLQR